MPDMNGGEYSPELQEQLKKALEDWQNDPDNQEAMRKALSEKQANGPLMWHDALTKYTELENEFKRLEARVRFIEVALTAGNIRIPE